MENKVVFPSPCLIPTAGVISVRSCVVCCVVFHNYSDCTSRRLGEEAARSSGKAPRWKGSIPGLPLGGFWRIN